MLIFFYLILLDCASVSWSVLGGASSSSEVSLSIEPISSREHGLSVVKRVQETLNLTCSVFKNSSDIETAYNMRWSIPNNSYNSKNRVIIQSSLNSVNLIVLHLEQRDEGDYICEAQPANRGGKFELLSEVVKVNVKNRRKICGEAQFFCGFSKLQTCIHRRFKCDGYQDCQMGEDEDPEMCGDPCINKLRCEFNMADNTITRCIPKTWCCNFKEDVNCTTKEPLSCCPLSFEKSSSDEKSYYATHHPRFSDVTLLQTTVYTVIGCSVVFMVVVTVLVIAICRVHIKRSVAESRSATHPPSRRIQDSSVYDLDIYLNRSCMMDNFSSPAFLITYNINNGVQIVGHAVDPPPYSKEICVPPKEGPPPPYSCHEPPNEPESEALLHQPTMSQSDQSNREVEEISQSAMSVQLLPHQDNTGSF